MNYFLKYRFAIWSVIILSVIILSSVGTFFILKTSHKEPENKRFSQIMHFFKDELKLTPEQEKIFSVSRHEFFRHSKTIFDSLENKRQLMILEMCKPKPDTLVLYQIADQIGFLHAELKRTSIKHLLNLRSICTPEQVKKLNTINGELIGPEGPISRMRPHNGQKPDGKRKPD